jgi:DNA-binding beta-propeller fold protein YncE
MSIKKHLPFYFLITVLLLACSQEPPRITAVLYDPVEGEAPYHWCTQIYFNKGMELVVDNQNSRVLYRRQPQTAFTTARLFLFRPHAIVYNPFDALYYVADTGNNSIIAFDQLTTPRHETRTSRIAGTNLLHPHDITIDPDTGWLYSLNPRMTTIFKFKGFGKKEKQLDLSAYLGYARSLSFIKGRLFVVGSAYGRVVEIVDFDKGIFSIHQSAGKKRMSSAGRWEDTGLVLNDIEFFQGYWYASSYFYPSPLKNGQDYNKNKLICFKTWKQFERGQWWDISHLIPGKLVPYFLTVHGNNLYITLFNHQDPGNGDCIYRLFMQ